MGFKTSKWCLGLQASLFLAVCLGGCADRGFDDLDAFMADKRARPGGVIEPIPTFKPYEPFA